MGLFLMTGKIGSSEAGGHPMDSKLSNHAEGDGSGGGWERFRREEGGEEQGVAPARQGLIALSITVQGLTIRTGSWMGPPRGGRAPRVGIGSTEFGVRAEGAALLNDW